MITNNRRCVASGFYITSIIITIILGLFAALGAWMTMHSSKILPGQIMAQDITKITQTLRKINEDCVIASFDQQTVPIDFLNVGSFSGSEVGQINLAYPEKWQGPYLKESPNFKNIPYAVVTTKKGYFVVPGNGVQLPNGKIIGKDIVLDENADVMQLAKNPEGLNFKGKALAAQLKIGYQKEDAVPAEQIDIASSIITYIERD